MTLKLALETVARRFPDKTAIVLGDSRLSYGELDSASNQVADALLNLGVASGDRVAMLLSNSSEFVIAFFGIVKMGAVAVPLDPQYRTEEVTALFEDCRPAVLVSESPYLEPIVPLLPEFDYVKHVIDMSPVCGGQFVSYCDVMEEGSPEPVDGGPGPDDTAVILYTSGPSSTPRGVMLSHRNMVSEAKIMRDAFEQTERDVVMLYALPMFHVFGLVAVLLSAIVSASSVVIVHGTGLSISSFLAAIEREKGTVFFAVPYIFALAVDMAEKEGIKSDLRSLRVVSSSADFLPAKLAKRFKELYGFKILDCFALTEAVCHVTCPPLDGSGRAGSVGKALPGWEIRIVDDADIDVPVGQPGEIVLRGPFMSGYFGNPAVTAETLRGGWLHTGDIGKKDKDGYLFITGRKKDLIIVKGQNIHPVDVESVVARHQDVDEVAVIGVPDEMRGEVVGAAIVLKAGSTAAETDIKKFCLERLASYKVPKQIILVDSLPHFPGGKIDKESLRRRLSFPSQFERVVLP